MRTDITATELADRYQKQIDALMDDDLDAFVAAASSEDVACYRDNIDYSMADQKVTLFHAAWDEGAHIAFSLFADLKNHSFCASQATFREFSVDPKIRTDIFSSGIFLENPKEDEKPTVEKLREFARRQLVARGFEEESLRFAKDSCENCNGAKGGVAGNENVIHGVVLCDYCEHEIIAEGGDPAPHLRAETEETS